MHNVLFALINLLCTSELAPPHTNTFTYVVTWIHSNKVVRHFKMVSQLIRRGSEENYLLVLSRATAYIFCAI